MPTCSSVNLVGDPTERANRAPKPLPDEPGQRAALSTTSLAVVYAVLVESGLNTTKIGKLIMSACFVMGPTIAVPPGDRKSLRGGSRPPSCASTKRPAEAGRLRVIYGLNPSTRIGTKTTASFARTLLGR
jgi:hypothetical protein